MNEFGGNWTQQKVEIVVKYAKAYLHIMKKHPYWKLLYFDGFAGSGDIESGEVDEEQAKGTAIRILEITEPREFDMYYFVEKKPSFQARLQTIVKDYRKEHAYVVCDDCNIRMRSMAEYLKAHPKTKALAYVDPYGMSVDWSSIEALKGLDIDLWILVPTGIGVNRLLKTNGDISDAWLSKLEKFLGLEAEVIRAHFYKSKIEYTLFGESKIIEKDAAAVDKAAILYRQRLNEVFKFVSTPFVMKNSTNSVMYHFMMASNNKVGLKIADEVIKPYYS
jgi:three-Cys-motif partner protein